MAATPAFAFELARPIFVGGGAEVLLGNGQSLRSERRSVDKRTTHRRWTGLRQAQYKCECARVRFAFACVRGRQLARTCTPQPTSQPEVKECLSTVRQHRHTLTSRGHCRDELVGCKTIASSTTANVFCYWMPPSFPFIAMHRRRCCCRMSYSTYAWQHSPCSIFVACAAHMRSCMALPLSVAS